jgi:hypothetical protein
MDTVQMVEAMARIQATAITTMVPHLRLPPGLVDMVVLEEVRRRTL